MLRWFGGFLRRGTSPTASASISIETIGGVATPVLVRGAPLPVEHTETFSTGADDQDRIEIRPYQGERPLARDNRLLGTFTIADIPPAARGVPRYEVTFRLDERGAFTLQARDRATGRLHPIGITNEANASDVAAIEQLLVEAATHEDTDRATVLRLEARRELSHLVVTADETFAPIQDRLTLAQNEGLAKALVDAAQLLESDATPTELLVAARATLDDAIKAASNALN